MPGTEQPLAHRSNTVGHSRDGLRPNVTASSGRRLRASRWPVSRSRGLLRRPRARDSSSGLINPASLPSGSATIAGSRERARSGLKGRWVPGLVDGELPAVRQANGGQ
jgi:hypothetical protein